MPQYTECERCHRVTANALALGVFVARDRRCGAHLCAGCRAALSVLFSQFVRGSVIHMAELEPARELATGREA
jgi:hypothetical protein